MARRAADWVDLQYSYILEQLAAAAPRTHGRLLDVGCGDKQFEHFFRPFVTEYIGLEYGDTFGATSASVSGKKPDVYYDGKVFPFESKSFDTVLSVQVLEHTPDPLALLKEMARVLRPGGIVVLNAPFSFRLHEEPHDYFRYTPHGYRALFDAAGLKVDEVIQMGDLWSVMAHKFNSYLAFRVAHLDAIGQSLGKLGQEGVRTKAARYWTFPFVLPTMGLTSASARVLDRFAPDGTEALSFQVIGSLK